MSGRDQREIERNCDVCGRRKPLNGIASGIAPVTYAICDVCAEKGAESIGVLEFWLASFGGPQKAPNVRSNLKSYFDGEYRDWQQICDHFVRNKEQILSSFELEFELVDDELGDID